VVLAVLFATGALAGCGGGDDSTASEELTHAQVIKQGDAICARYGTEASEELRTKLQAATQGIDAATEEELVLTINVPAIEGIATDLGQLQASSEDQEELEAIAGAFGDAAVKIKSNPRPTDPTKSPYDEASNLAAAFGFVECSKF